MPLLLLPLTGVDYCALRRTLPGKDLDLRTPAEGLVLRGVLEVGVVHQLRDIICAEHEVLGEVLGEYAVSYAIQGTGFDCTTRIQLRQT